jgi:hypothetical protein
MKRDMRLSPAEDYNFLRRTGIAMIQDLCGDTWTDYNAHDPGITLLEAYCYALTELGYRTSFDIKDILASRHKDAGDWSAVFYTPDRILPSNPVTIADYRKLITDIAGVRNAWVEKSEDYEVPLYLAKGQEGNYLSYDPAHGIAILPLKGLYRVLVEFEEDVIREGRDEDILRRVKEKLHLHRNLCEDFVSISPVEYEPFALEAEIKVHEGYDIELVTARIYKVIRDLFSPAVNFYTPEQMRQRGYGAEDLFEGPLLHHGFIDTAELEASAINEVQLSDIISLVTDIEGVIAIEKFSIPKNAGDSFPDFTEWLARIKDQQKTPKLDTKQSQVSFIRNGDRHRTAAEKKADPAKVEALLNYLLAGNQKVKLKSYERAWEPGAGEYMELEEYFPFQRSLPVCYGMEETFLAGPVDVHPPDATPLDDRKRKVLQLRGFLLPFEQILANYLSQLAHIRELFSFDPSVESTYFTQLPEGVRDLEALFVDLPAYRKQAAALLESDSARLGRRNALLDHLLGRFGEVMGAPPTSSPSAPPVNEKAAEKSIADKTAFLQDAVALSNYRGKGFDYIHPEDAWDTDNVAGCKKRICRLLGMPGYSRSNIASESLFIGETRHSNDVLRYAVRLSDPSDRERLLLQSVEYESRKEAEAALDYILEQGNNPHLYELDIRHEKAAYHLQRRTGEGETEIVASGHFRHKDEMEEHFKRLLDVLKTFSEEENFHLIEHILLRPRINARGTTAGRHHPVIDKETVTLLPVPEEGDGLSPGQDTLQPPPYRFKMTQLTGAGHNEGWKLSLVNAAGEEVFFIPEPFPFYKHLTRRIEHLRQLASDGTSYRIDSVADGYFVFVIQDGGQRLAEGKKKYKKEEAAKEEVDRLVRFFSFDQHAGPEEPAGEDTDAMAGLDPYSFHVTVVLPAWPARFRDPGFRHLLEKTLFLEIPAHVYPHVYWVGHQEMRRFEEAYRLWLDEQCNATIPNTEILNNFLHELLSFHR